MTDQSDPCYLTGVQALGLFRRGELSPVELLCAQIERAKQTEPTINAFTETFFKQAMAEAQQAEKRYLARAGDLRPLEGLTVAIKDVLDQQGARNTRGSLIYKDNFSDRDHPVVARIRAAGGIIHARTTTSEFAFGWITATRLWGVTRNPWNPQLTPGGSSGGAAASLAVGSSTLAIGTDSAGSIRVPAALCGVVGYKPPRGRVPDPSDGHDPFNAIGSMARCVADCALLQNVISGIHPDDATSLREKPLIPLYREPLANMRLAITLDLGMTAPTSEIARVTREVAAKLSARGVSIHEPAIGWPAGITENARLYSTGLVAPELLTIEREHGAQLCDYTQHAVAAARECSLIDVTRGMATARDLYRELVGILEDFDALICPVVLTNRIGAEQKPWVRMMVNGVELDSDYDWVTTPHFNMLGELPAFVLPIGQDADGLPVGLQIVTRSFDDLRAFLVASTIEQLLNGDRPQRFARPGLGAAVTPVE